MFKLNERLRELRIKNGYTQSQVAKILNIDRSTYAYYETGKTRPDVSSLLTLSRVFNISISELLADESFPQNVAEPNIVHDYMRAKKNSSHIYELSTKEKELVGAFRACSVEQQKQILKFIFNTIKNDGETQHPH